MLKFEDKILLEVFNPTVPVVFLHAFPVNSRMWKPQMAFLRNKGVAYFAYDYPGFGMSQLMKERMNIEDYGEYIHRILIKFGVPKAVFIGLSMGGYVALSLLRRHPEFFCGLLLANTRADADSEQARERRRQMVESLKTSRDLTPVFDSHIKKFFTEDNRKNRPQLMIDIEKMMRNATIEGVIQAQLAMADRPDSINLLDKINFPVSVIAGEADTLTSVDDAGIMAESIPGTKLHVLKNTAHLSNWEQSDQFNDILWKLIQRSMTP